MAKLWEKTKKAGSSVGHSIGNAAHSVTGPKHRTKDEHFIELQHKFDEKRKKLETMQKDITAFLTCTEALLASIEAIALDGLSLTATGGALKTLSEQQIATVKKIREDKKNYLEPQIQDQFLKPLQAYMGQYREITTRIGERGKRKDEMDKLKEKKDKMQEKNDPKLAEVNPKYDVAKQGYDDLNDELIQDMPLLMDDTEKFVAPLGTSEALFISNQTKFFQALNAHSVGLQQSADLSIAQVPQVHEVITPKPNSAVSRTYQPNPNSYVVTPAAGGSGGPSPRTTNPVVSPRSTSTGAANPPAGYPYGQPQQASQLSPPVHQTGGGVSPRTSSYAPAPAPGVPARAAAQPPIPPRVPQARAMWDFNGNPGELSFRAGDIINVHASQGDWWQGEIPGVGRGAFPGNYVQLI